MIKNLSRELGVVPSGPFPTVDDRLDNIERHTISNADFWSLSTVYKHESPESTFEITSGWVRPNEYVKINDGLEYASGVWSFNAPGKYLVTINCTASGFNAISPKWGINLLFYADDVWKNISQTYSNAHTTSVFSTCSLSCIVPVGDLVNNKLKIQYYTEGNVSLDIIGSLDTAYNSLTAVNIGAL